MGNQFFDEDAHAAATTKILAKVPAMQAELKLLDGQMQTLFASWKGRASQSHQRVHADWSQNYTQLNTALQGIGDMLRKNHRTTQGADVGSTITGA
jgi:WXG100 family type VII secretion target